MNTHKTSRKYPCCFCGGKTPDSLELFWAYAEISHKARICKECQHKRTILTECERCGAIIGIIDDAYGADMPHRIVNEVITTIKALGCCKCSKIYKAKPINASMRARIATKRKLKITRMEDKVCAE